MVTGPARRCLDRTYSIVSADAQNSKLEVDRYVGAADGCAAGSSQRSVIPISDYTVVNLKEVENSAGDNAALEAHFGRKHLGSDHLGVSHFRAGPGFRSEKGHSHREQEEVYIVVAGSGRIKLNDEIVELRPWDAVRVAPATVRALEAGPDGLEFIAVGTDRPEGGDGMQTENFWDD